MATYNAIFQQLPGEDTRRFLPTAPDVDTIRLRRIGRGVGKAHANIPHRWVVHSPDGFEWGYGGSGPADLALNILGLFVPPAEAWRLHQEFKASVIAKIPREEGDVLPTRDIISWIQDYWKAEQS